MKKYKNNFIDSKKYGDYRKERGGIDTRGTIGCFGTVMGLWLWWWEQQNTKPYRSVKL